MEPSLDDICRRTVDARLEGFSDCCRGNRFAQVACVCSTPLPLPGDVSEALGKAFVALGWADEPFFLVSAAQVEGVRLRDCLEAQDPLVVVALDHQAGRMVAEAYDVDEPPYGVVAVLPFGRRVVVVEDFPASLAALDTKRAAWAQLQASAAEK